MLRLNPWTEWASNSNPVYGHAEEVKSAIGADGTLIADTSSATMTAAYYRGQAPAGSTCPKTFVSGSLCSLGDAVAAEEWS